MLEIGRERVAGEGDEMLLEEAADDLIRKQCNENCGVGKWRGL